MHNPVASYVGRNLQLKRDLTAARIPWAVFFHEVRIFSDRVTFALTAAAKANGINLAALCALDEVETGGKLRYTPF